MCNVLFLLRGFLLMLVVVDKSLPEDMSGLIHMFEEMYMPLHTI